MPPKSSRRAKFTRTKKKGQVKSEDHEAQAVREGDSANSSSQDDTSQDNTTSSQDDSSSQDNSTSQDESTSQGESTSQDESTSEAAPSGDHSSSAVYVEERQSASVDETLVIPPDLDLVKMLLEEVRASLNESWTVICDKSSVHLLYLSPTEFKAVQREVKISYAGEAKIAVHGSPVPSDITLEILSSSPPPVILSASSLKPFVERCFALHQCVMRYSVCVGGNHLESEKIWSYIENTFVDLNPCHEAGYIKTCRSKSCQKLVPLSRKNLRCPSCAKVLKILKKRIVAAEKTDFSLTTNNRFLTLDQANEKLKLQSEEIKKKNKRIAYLESKITNVLDSEGVDLDEATSTDLNDILQDCDTLTEVQKMFLHEQLKMSARSDARGHRWHPAMIRLALHIRMVSSAAYDALCDSGVIKLPSSRTLFNYSNFVSATEGVNPGLLELLEKQVKEHPHLYQQYHVLLVDEMHISQNLVYRKCDESLVGYVYLDQVDKELAEFEKSISLEQSTVTPTGPALAKTMLAFLVKGLCSSKVKCVVASYPCLKLNRDMLYSRSWSVISQLELAGVKVLAYVADGNLVNRAFFDLHECLSKVDSGVIFDTVNHCAPDRRPIYFISDVCHLLKTVRNCFYNSGEEASKPRCLIYNGEKILWKTITRLYLMNKNNTFRKSYKLNPQNVFLNSFSCMKVKFAAEVLSKTVASDIKSQNWPDTSETVNFLLTFNRWFDCLNGAYSLVGQKCKNPDLAPYTAINDERFAFFDEFLVYIEDWRKQSQALELPLKEREKTTLSWQTLNGLQIATRAIVTCISFLLVDPQKAEFVMARSFSQDPIEQHFSCQRSGGGGNTNPNAATFMKQQVSLTVQGQLGVKRRRGNVEDEDEELELLSKKLPKRSDKR